MEDRREAVFLFVAAHKFEIGAWQTYQLAAGFCFRGVSGHEAGSPRCPLVPLKQRCLRPILFVV